MIDLLLNLNANDPRSVLILYGGPQQGAGIYIVGYEWQGRFWNNLDGSSPVEILLLLCQAKVAKAHPRRTFLI